MTYVGCRRAVLPGDVIRVWRNSANAAGVAHRAIKNVEAKQGNSLIQPGIDINNDLVLVVNPRRFHKGHGPWMPQWKCAAARYIWIEGSRKRRVDIVRSE